MNLDLEKVAAHTEAVESARAEASVRRQEVETLVEEQKEKQEVLKSSIKLEDAAEQELVEAQAKAAEANEEQA